MTSNLLLIHLDMHLFFDDARKYTILDVNIDIEPTVKEILRKICFTFDIDVGGEAAEDCIALFYHEYFLPQTLSSISLTAMSSPLLVKPIVTTFDENVSSQNGKKKIDVIVLPDSENPSSRYSSNSHQRFSRNSTTFDNNTEINSGRTTSRNTNLNESRTNSSLGYVVRYDNSHSTFSSNLTCDKSSKNSLERNISDCIAPLNEENVKKFNEISSSNSSRSQEEIEIIATTGDYDNSKPEKRKRKRKHNKKLKREKRRVIGELEAISAAVSSNLPGTQLHSVKNAKNQSDFVLKRKDAVIVPYEGSKSKFITVESDEMSCSGDDSEVLNKVSLGAGSEDSNVFASNTLVSSLGSSPIPQPEIRASPSLISKSTPHDVPRPQRRRSSINSDSLKKFVECSTSNEVHMFDVERNKSNSSAKAEKQEADDQKQDNKMESVTPPKPVKFEDATDLIRNTFFSVTSVESVDSPLVCDRSDSINLSVKDRGIVWKSATPKNSKNSTSQNDKEVQIETMNSSLSSTVGSKRSSGKSKNDISIVLWSEKPDSQELGSKLSTPVVDSVENKSDGKGADNLLNASFDPDKTSHSQTRGVAKKVKSTPRRVSGLGVLMQSLKKKSDQTENRNSV